MAGENLPRVQVASVLELRDWLAKHGRRNGSVWLVTFKKGDSFHIPYAEIADELLCFGWVDSLPRKLDADRTMLLIAPRKRKSNWSKINKDKAERLIAEGRMRPEGLEVIQAAIAGGQWDALNDIESLAIPGDLAAKLANWPDARTHFDAFPKSTKRGILEWIAAARSSETRARRVTETAMLAQDNVRANQWRQPADKTKK